RTIIVQEPAALDAVAQGLVQSGTSVELNSIRDELARLKLPNGPTRFVPLPEMTKPREPAALGHSTEVQKIRRRSAAALYDLAREAATSESAQYALASFCLRGVIEREPDHKEARRLLGYVPYDGAWQRRLPSASSNRRISATRRSAGCRRAGFLILTAVS